MATTFELISSTTVGSGGAASIEFTSIPSRYTDLVVKLSARSDRNSFTSTYVNVSFNGSTSGYTSRVSGSNSSSVVNYTNLEGTSAMGVLVISQSNNTASTFGNSELYIPNYTGSSYKSCSADSVQEDNGTTGWQFIGTGLWSNTAAITSIKFQPISGGTNYNFLQYSTAYLYGVKNA